MPETVRDDPGPSVQKRNWNLSLAMYFQYINRLTCPTNAEGEDFSSKCATDGTGARKQLSALAFYAITHRKQTTCNIHVTKQTNKQIQSRPVQTHKHRLHHSHKTTLLFGKAKRLELLAPTPTSKANFTS